MPTIRLTATACSVSGSGWETLYYYKSTNSSYTPRTINFRLDSAAELAGVGVNITRITVHGYARNSASTTKRLRWGFRDSLSAAPTVWSTIGDTQVLSGTFVAVEASSSGYKYSRFAQTYDGNNALARHLKARFDAGEPVYLGVIEPDSDKSIQVNLALAEWYIDVDYDLMGNIPTTNTTTGTLGSTQITTTINKVIEGSTTRLRYMVGGTLVDVADLGAGVSHTFAPSVDLGAYFPATLTGVLTIAADTYVDDKLCGSVETSVTLGLPADAAPECSCTVIRVWADDVDAAARIGAYVQSKSGAAFALTGAGKYGAEIAGYTLAVENRTYAGDSPVHAVFVSAGTVTYIYTVTDSRGLVSSFAGQINVLAWEPPRIQGFSITRATVDGVEAIDGTYAKCTAQASASPLAVGGVEQNTLTLIVEYREIADDAEYDWTAADGIVLSSVAGTVAGLLSHNGALIGGGGADGNGNLPFNDMAGYEFRLVARDIYGTGVAYDQMPTKAVHWDVDNASGNMGFGGEAPDASEDVGYRFYRPTEFAAGIYGADGVRLDVAMEQVITTLGASFQPYTAGEYPRVRRVGRMVYLSGVLKPKTTLSGSNTGVEMFTLPAEYRPPEDVHVLCQGTSNAIWLCLVDTAGVVTFSRYRNGSSSASAGTSVWLPFNVMYFV